MQPDSGKLANGKYLRKSLDVFRIVARHRVGNEVTGKTIEEMTGINKRIVAAMLREFEASGFMVISTGNGYALAKDITEWKTHLDKEYQRGLKLMNKVSQSKKHRDNAPEVFDTPQQMIAEGAIL